ARDLFGHDHRRQLLESKLLRRQEPMLPVDDDVAAVALHRHHRRDESNTLDRIDDARNMRRARLALVRDDVELAYRQQREAESPLPGRLLEIEPLSHAPIVSIPLEGSIAPCT